MQPLLQSSSLVIVDPKDNILMLTRKKTMSFPGAAVFPGGRCDPDDNPQGLKPFTIFSKYTAIRETLQQTGMLLIPESKQSQIDNALSGKCTLRQIWKDDLNLLNPIIRFLTIQQVKGKRFDCIFYALSPSVLKVIKNKKADYHSIQVNEESSSYLWATAAEIIGMYENKQLNLAPPQILLLTAFKNLNTYSRSLSEVLFYQGKRCQDQMNPFQCNPASITLLHFCYRIIQQEPSSQSKSELLNYWSANPKKQLHRRVVIGAKPNIVKLVTTNIQPTFLFYLNLYPKL